MAAQLSAEQQAFLDRKRNETSNSPPPVRAAAVPRRGDTHKTLNGNPTASAHAVSGLHALQLATNSATALQWVPCSAAPQHAQDIAPQRRAHFSLLRAPMLQPTRGRSNSARPTARPPSSRPSSSRPAPVAAAPSYSAPAAAGGLTPEQKEFLDRQRRERSASPVSAPTRGRSNSARPTARPPSSRPSSASRPVAAAAAPSYSAPAPAGGLTPEQQEFLDRQRRERSASPVSAPTRGRSNSARPTARPPSSRPSSASRPVAAAAAPSYSAPAPAGGLTPEQQEFLDRQRRERSASPVSAPTRGRSNSARPTARPPSSRPSSASRPVTAAAAPSYSAPAPAGGLTPEQQEFLDRQRRERSASPASAPTRGRSNSARPTARPPSSRPSSASRPVAAAAAPSYSAPAPVGGLTPEQQEFLDRQRRERSASPAPAPTRGRSASTRPSSVRPSSSGRR